MKISIRKSKHQKASLAPYQFKFASECVSKYMKENSHDKDSYMVYEGFYMGDKLSCDVYQTKTTISAIVRFLENGN